MDIALIIPAYNEEEWIGRTLDSVFSSTQSPFSEVVVVDNGSTDRTAQIAASYAGVRVISEVRRGTGFARDAGYRATTAPLIAYLDADTLLSASWARRVTRAFARDPKLACVSGPYWFHDMPRVFSFTYVLLWHVVFPLFLMLPIFITGGNLAIRRSILDQMGGFNTGIVFHGDEADLGRRAAVYGKVRPLWGLVLKSSGRRFKALGTLRMLATYMAYALGAGGMEHVQTYIEVR